MPLLTRPDAAHLCRRIGFGGSPRELETLTGRERSVAVEQVLDLTAAPAVVRPTGIDPTQSQWSAWVIAVDWWVRRMVTTPTPLQETMTLFWHSHFATQSSKVGDMAFMFDQQETLRAFGLGDFSQLCTAIATDPAMLVELDNHSNTKEAPQENFGRELMELFTLGLGNYDEADVSAMARAWTGHGLTGWTMNGFEWSYKFHPDRHDPSLKTLFGITRPWNGPETIEEIVHGSGRPACARFVAAKLFRALAHPSPSATTIAQIASEFERSGMRVDALVRAILLHDEFWSPTSRYALVKSPVDFVIDLLRRTGVTIEKAWVQSALVWMGQKLFDPPSVRGWGENEEWLSTSSMCARGTWLRHMRWETNGIGLWADLAASSPATAAGRVFADLGVDAPSATTRQAFERWFGEAVAADSRPVPGLALVFAGLCPELQVK